MKTYGSTIYFNDWLKEEGHVSRSNIVDDMASDGKSEEEINEYLDELGEQFEEYAEENGYEPQYV